MEYFATIHFPFGDLDSSASWGSDQDDPNVFRLARASLTPRLPPGMSVDLAATVVGTISSVHAIYNFRFALQFSNSVPKGSAETGESLDAQSFDIAQSRIMIGTEDGEAIASRLKWFQLNDKTYPIGYLPNGFELSFDYIPPHAVLDFHFIIAYNSKACDDSSEWFAVDVPHLSVLRLDLCPIPSS